MKTKRNGTQTSSFGVTARVNHDSSRFYNSKLYEEIVPQKITIENENPIPPEYLNKIFCKSSEKMEELPDNSVHLMVTSPPYNVGKDYDENQSLEEYLDLLRNVFSETHRVLVSGGRACINIANIGRKPYIPLHSHIIKRFMINLSFFPFFLICEVFRLAYPNLPIDTRFLFKFWAISQNLS
ncbi:MAG: DNA methyltransferase, partial [Methanofastidiosum sp.]